MHQAVHGEKRGNREHWGFGFWPLSLSHLHPPIGEHPNWNPGHAEKGAGHAHTSPGAVIKAEQGQPSHKHCQKTQPTNGIPPAPSGSWITCVCEKVTHRPRMDGSLVEAVSTELPEDWPIVFLVIVGPSFGRTYGELEPDAASNVFQAARYQQCLHQDSIQRGISCAMHRAGIDFQSPYRRA